MTIIIISLFIGLAIGCLINYAITFKTGQARNIGICVVAALVGGALIPWALHVPTIWAAVVGSMVALAVVLYVWARVANTA